MNEADRRRTLADMAVRGDQLITDLCHQLDAVRAAGADTTRPERQLAGLEPLIADLHDLEAVVAISAVVERHGDGPYPLDDLAAIAGISTEACARALRELVAAGVIDAVPE
jgi:predicted Rossmann fold nucleotide-binding protein DprA/Smf involved in DNA uptake